MDYHINVTSCYSSMTLLYMLYPSDFSATVAILTSNVLISRLQAAPVNTHTLLAQFVTVCLCVNISREFTDHVLVCFRISRMVRSRL